MNDSIKSGKGKSLQFKTATMGEIAVDAALSILLQKPENLKRIHDTQLQALLLEGYKYAPFVQYDVFDNLPEQQRTFINTLCDFKYYAEHSGGGLYVTSAAAEIYMGLISGRLSSTFTLSELKAFIIRNDIELRDDWKTRLELLESAGIETETTHITPGAGPGTSTKPASGGSIKQNIAGMCTPSELMQIYGIPKKKESAFTKALQRWRKKNEGSPDYSTHDCPAKNKHHYRYRGSSGAIQDIIKCYTEKG